MNNKSLLGPDGKSINEASSQSNLPIEIQNLVEIRVNTALDQQQQASNIPGHLQAMNLQLTYQVHRGQK